MGLFSSLVSRLQQKDVSSKVISTEIASQQAVADLGKPAQGKQQVRYSSKTDSTKLPCPVAANEEARLKTVKALGLYTMQPGQEVDALLKTVATVFAAPITSVALFLEGHGNICSAYNSDPGLVSMPNAICFWALVKPHPAVLTVEDLTQDSRFAHTCWVELGLRAYMSSPLVAANGHRVGSLCFFDVKPRRFDQAQVRTLANLAELAVRLLESRAGLARLLREEQLLRDTFSLLRRSVSSLQRCVLLVDVAQPGCAVLYANPGWEALTGMACSALAGGPLTRVFSSSSRRSLAAAMAQMASSGKAFRLSGVELVAGCSGSSLAEGVASPDSRRYALNFRPAASGAMDDDVLLVNCPAHVPCQSQQEGSAPAPCTPASPDSLYFVTVALLAGALAEGADALVTEEAAAGVPLIPGLAVHQLLGAGSYATVYRGTWNGEMVAVKVSQPFHSQHEDLQRAVYEVKLAQQMRHPHIVRTLTYALLQHSAVHEAADDVLMDHGVMDGECTVTPLLGNSTSQPGASGAGSKQSGGGEAAVVAGVLGQRLVDMAWDDVTEGEGSSGQAGQLAGGRSAPWDKAAACAQLEHDMKVKRASASGWEPPKQPSSSGSSSMAPPSPLCARHGSTAAHSEGASTLPPESTAGQHLSVDTSSSNTDSGAHSSAAALAPHAQRTSAPSSLRVSMTAVMEYCDKGCLQDALDIGWLREDRRPSGAPCLPFILQTLLEVCDALQELHARDVVHGDLTTFNVLLCGKGLAAQAGGRGFVAKVADFGLSHSLAATAMVCINSYGTVTHMAPEVLLAGISSKAADVYSFGVLMWQALTFERPWSRMRHQVVVAAVAQERRCLQWPPHVPAHLADLGRACMAWEPAQRPDMGQVRRRLVAALEAHSGAQHFVEDW